jgi:Calcineurin-like phosphoesterase
MKRVLGVLLFPVAILLSVLTSSAQSPPDSVRYSFVYFGCNRIQASDWKGMEATDPSSANVPQLNQSLIDIASLNPLPAYFFFVGDLVVNLAPDNGTTLKQQLDGWMPIYNASPLAARTTLIALPGNHEMLQKVSGNEVPNPATPPVWLAWLTANHLDGFAGNGPTPAGTNSDQLVDDQSKLTYSFDRDGTHFVLLNTDTTNKPNQTGWIAYNWIANDLQQAQANPNTAAIFVLGHKPIVSPKAAAGADDTILNTSQYPLATALQQLLSGTPKVKAYLCAHAHLWDARQLGGAGSAWQVIAGNGGSQVESQWLPSGGPFYGFTLVKLYTSGQVSVTSYQRPVPNPYFSADPRPSPASPQPEMFLPR